MVEYGAESVFVSDLVSAVRTRLTAGAGIGISRPYVFFSLANPATLAKVAPADQFLAFQPTSLPTDHGLTVGGAPGYTQFNSTWKLSCFSRLGTDQQYKDFEFVNQQSLGLAVLVEKVCQRLEIKSLTSEDTTPTGGVVSSPLVQPARVLSIAFHEREPAPGWGWADVVAELKFYTDLT